MTRPRLLDLFCGAGGASMGYSRAGFDVTGVDNRPQPNYPFTFVQADALEYVREHGHEYDVIAASPPCQAFSNATVIHGVEHPDLLTPLRPILQAIGRPWVIGNVPGAPMRRDFELCGSMFGLRSGNGRLIRHRWFECGGWDVPFQFLPPCQHNGPTISVFGHGGHVYHGLDDWRTVMGIDWMSRDELAQAIPPAYTEHIGAQLLLALTPAVAAA